MCMALYMYMYMQEGEGVGVVNFSWLMWADVLLQEDVRRLEQELDEERVREKDVKNAMM